MILEVLNMVLPLLRLSRNSKVNSALTQQPTTSTLSFSDILFFNLLLLLIPLKAEKWDLAGSNSYSHSLLFITLNCFSAYGDSGHAFKLFFSDSIQHFWRTPFEI